MEKLESMAEMKQDTGSAPVEKSAAMTAGEIQAEIATREAATMTRRAALAKIGLRGGMAIFAAFSIDDLARKAATVLSQQGRDNKVVDEVARQMHNAGVSFAATGGGNATPDPCQANVDSKVQCLSRSSNDYASCLGQFNEAYCQCEKDNRDAICRCNYRDGCVNLPNCNCGPTPCPGRTPCAPPTRAD